MIINHPINVEHLPKVGPVSPAQGEHSRQILGELGMTDKEIETLAKDGAVVSRLHRIKRANGRYGYYFECLPGIPEHLLRMQRRLSPLPMTIETGSVAELFNGKDLDAWTVKIAGQPVGQDKYQTLESKTGFYRSATTMTVLPINSAIFFLNSP